MIPNSILLINYEYPPLGGGAGNATYFLAKSLAKKGHTVSVLTAAFEEHSGYSLNEGIHLYRIRSSRSSLSQANPKEMFSFVYKSFFHLSKIIKKHKVNYSIIYFSIPCGPIGLYLKYLYKIPYIISLRGGDVPGLVKDLDPIHSKIKYLRRLILSKSIVNIANAEGLANLNRNVDPQEIKVVPNGVDIEFYDGRINYDLSVINFIFVGRFHEQKNLFYCLDQFKKVTLKYNNIKLHLVGDGPLKDELIKYSKDLEVYNYLKWHGWLTKVELKDLYHEAHIMINPSHYEGLPNTVLEGMASSLAVIASDIPGNNDLVISGENGYLFDLKEKEALYQVIIELLNHNQIIEMGKKGREKVKKTYSWDNVAERYLSFLN